MTQRKPTPTSTGETGEVADDRPEQSAEQINWNVRVNSDSAGCFDWEVWTEHNLWLPLSVTGRAHSEEDANAVARKVATRCTEAVRVYMQGTGVWDVKFALMNVFPDTPAGGGSPVGRLSFMGGEPDDERDRWSDLEARALDWQTRGGRQTFVALDSSEQESGPRLRELFGCMGALGEQATLACATARDLAAEVAAPESPRAELIRRAWAEHVIHWTMAAGHMFQNLVGRAVALDPTVRPHLLKRQGATSEKSRRKALGTQFLPESDAKEDWPTFNKTHANYVRRAAEVSTVPAVVAIGELVHRVAVDPRWVTMSALRDEAFHRWRAQTAGVSTMTRRATRIVGDDGLLPGGEVPDVRGPESAAKATACAESALQLLGEALEEFDSLLPDVLRSLTSTVMYDDGLLASYGSYALVESSPGTGVMILSISPEQVNDFLRAITVGASLPHRNA